MLAALLGTVAGLAGGVAVGRWAWPRHIRVLVEPPWHTHRFNVVLSTGHGAEARSAYEQLTPRQGSTSVVQFFDGLDQRGEKRA